MLKEHLKQSNMAAVLEFKAEKALGMKKGLWIQGGITPQKHYAPSPRGFMYIILYYNYL